MTPDPAEDEANATDSESLLLYHLIGWGIAGIVLVSVIYAVLVTPPPSSPAYDWIEPLGRRGRIRAWSSAFGRTALRTTIGLTILCIAVAAVMKFGMGLKNHVADE